MYQQANSRTHLSVLKATMQKKCSLALSTEFLVKIARQTPLENLATSREHKKCMTHMLQKKSAHQAPWPTIAKRPVILFTAIQPVSLLKELPSLLY